MRFITSARRADLHLVRDLIYADGSEWSTPLIEATFNDHDVRCILSIPLSSLVRNDELTWALTKNEVIR